MKIKTLLIMAMILIATMTFAGIHQSMESLQEDLDSRDIVMRTHMQDGTLWVWIDQDLDGVCDRVHWMEDTGRFTPEGDMLINISGPLPCEEADAMFPEEKPDGLEKKYEKYWE